VTRSVAALLCLAALSCSGEATAPPPPQQQQQQAPEPQKAAGAPVDRQPDPSDLDEDNLLNIAYGGSVVSRTGELTLDNSAVHAIDGMSTTRWSSPPAGPDQTMTLSLPSVSRITSIGVVTAASSGAGKVRFESSPDGLTWRELQVIEPKPVNEPQHFEVTAVEARYLRVSTVGVTADAAQFLSVQAFGTPVRPPTPYSVTGCWKINGLRAHLVQTGARITGIIEPGREGGKPTLLDGGSDGFVARLMWRRDPMWGNAAVTFAPNDRTMSALLFYQEPLTGNVGEAWFGERCDVSQLATLPAVPRDTPAAFLQRTGHWTLSGLLFDEHDQLVEPMSRDTLDALAAIVAQNPAAHFRIVAHELRIYGAAETKARTAAWLASLRPALVTHGVDLARVELVASGNGAANKETSFAVQPLLNSRIDLELVR